MLGCRIHSVYASTPNHTSHSGGISASGIKQHTQNHDAHNRRTRVRRLSPSEQCRRWSMVTRSLFTESKNPTGSNNVRSGRYCWMRSLRCMMIPKRSLIHPPAYLHPPAPVPLSRLSHLPTPAPPPHLDRDLLRTCGESSQTSQVHIRCKHMTTVFLVLYSILIAEPDTNKATSNISQKANKRRRRDQEKQCIGVASSSSFKVSPDTHLQKNRERLLCCSRDVPLSMYLLTRLIK